MMMLITDKCTLCAPNFQKLENLDSSTDQIFSIVQYASQESQPLTYFSAEKELIEIPIKPFPVAFINYH